MAYSIRKFSFQVIATCLWGLMVSAAAAQCVNQDFDPREPIDEPTGSAVARNPPTDASTCFQGARGAAIIADQPNLLIQRSAGSFILQTTQGAGDDGGFTGPVWASFSGRTTQLDNAELELGIGTLGSDVWTNENTIVGVLLQGDRSDQIGPTGTQFESSGYLLGVYGIQKRGELTLDGRLLAGQTQNDVDDGVNTASDVASTRWLTTFQVSGERPFATDGWFIPRISLGWFEDTMDAYTLGATDIKKQRVRYGQLDAGAILLYPISLGQTQGNLIFGASGLRAFGPEAVSQVPRALRGKIDLGVELFQGNSWSISAKIFADGLGQDDYEGVGGDLGVMFWF